MSWALPYAPTHIVAVEKKILLRLLREKNRNKKIQNHKYLLEGSVLLFTEIYFPLPYFFMRIRNTCYLAIKTVFV